MKIEFLKEAEIDIRETINSYNKKRTNLGFEFSDEILRTIEIIKDFPEAWPQISLRTRRSLVNRFPYGIIYQLSKDKLLIIAVMHLHGKPNSWRKRKIQN